MRLSQLSVVLSLALAAPLAGGAAIQDVLDRPAKESALASKSILTSVAGAGERLVTVGQRGHVVYSDDGGKSWRQAAVPVSSDLVAVTFPTPQKGWAVGHDGVVLHSADAGATWVRQLDGRSVGKRMESFYAELAKASPGDAVLSAMADEAKRVAMQGPENPFLDVWFADENTGFVVGAFNLIFRTADGGKTWEPWFHRTDNPGRLHLYAVRQVGDDIYISGEQGLLLRLDAQARRFAAVDTGYRGTYFGITGNEEAVLAFGLRGNAYRSTDGGKQWQKVDTGLQEGITGGAACGSKRIALVSQTGRMLLSDDAGASFRPVKLDQPGPASAVWCTAGTAIIAGPRGVRAQLIK